MAKILNITMAAATTNIDKKDIIDMFTKNYNNPGPNTLTEMSRIITE